MLIDRFQPSEVGVLGASGYLGKNICEKVSEVGMEVRNLGRKVSIREAKKLSIGIIVDAAFPTNNINAAIRAEYLNNLNHNLDVAIALNLRYIYIGSYSSDTRSKSKYGQLKREAERMVILKGGNILRAGLVIDYANPRGRFLQFVHVSRRLPFIPVLPQNWCPIFVTTIDDFCSEIGKSIIARRMYTIKAIGKKVSLSSLFEENSKSDRKCQIPEFFMFMGMHLAKILPLGKFDFIKSILYREGGI
jgi:uncharacterized protein YbjT (DUF2867 family)